MYKLYKGCNTKPNAFEENTGWIYTDKYKDIYHRTKHIATQVQLFRDNIYNKYTNTHGGIILEKLIPRLIQKVH